MSEHALPEEDRVRPSPGARHLWFALLGAGAAWMVRFMAAYLLLEVACRAGWQQQRLLGLNGVAVAVLLTTIVCAPVAAASGAMAWRTLRRGRAEATGDALERDSYIGGAGLFLSGLFLLAMLAETIPALVLAPCAYQ
jgi:hypothetical protein